MFRVNARRNAHAILVVAIVLTMAASSASRQPVVATLGSAQAEPETGGRAPIDTPVPTASPSQQASAPVAPPSSGGLMDVELLKWGVTQGGLTISLLIVLWSYKRTLDAQTKEEREDKLQVAAVLKESSAALISSAVETKRHTDATHRLARSVEHLEKKFT